MHFWWVARLRSQMLVKNPAYMAFTASCQTCLFSGWRHVRWGSQAADRSWHIATCTNETAKPLLRQDWQYGHSYLQCSLLRRLHRIPFHVLLCVPCGIPSRTATCFWSDWETFVHTNNNRKKFDAFSALGQFLKVLLAWHILLTSFLYTCYFYILFLHDLFADSLSVLWLMFILNTF